MTASTLVLKTPTAMKKKKSKIEDKISKVEGVSEVKELMMWEMSK